MLDVKNYFINLAIRLGFKRKPERVGVKMTNSKNISFIKSRISGFDTGIDAKNVDGLDLTNTKID